MEKWIGAILIIVGCGMAGFSMAAAHRREENALRLLLGALDYMECELQYRLTPLPELCRQAGTEARGCVGQVLTRLSQELERQISPDVESCMGAVLSTVPQIPQRTKEALRIMGSSLGRFNLEGQIKGMEAVRGYCRRELEHLSVNRDARLRGYQTLGLCAGAALAILLI